MTCIVAVRTESNVLMAADSMCTGGFDQYVTDFTKIYRIKPFLIGGSGWPRFMQRLSVLDLDQKSLPRTHSAMIKFMIQDFASLVSELYKELEVDSGGQEVRGNLLIAWKNSLFRFAPDNTFFEVDDAWAIGSGGEYALGSLHTSAKFLDLAAKD